MNRAAALGVLCTLVFVLPILLFLSGIVLRLSVLLANVLFERPAPQNSYDPRYGFQTRALPQYGTGIPVPDVARAMVIMFAVVATLAMVNIAISVAATKATRPNSTRILPLTATIGATNTTIVTIAAFFAANVALLAMFLPTSVARSSIVTIFQYLLLCLVIVVFSLLCVIAARNGGLVPSLLDQIRH